MAYAAPPEGEDSRVAQVLLSAGLLQLREVGPLLKHVRALRDTDPHSSLAGLLVSSGRIQEGELGLYLGTGNTAFPSPASGLGPLLPVAWSKGRLVAGYELGEVLGQGGMGVILSARQLGTGRKVALKAVHLQGDPDLAERFTREAAAMASVDGHPNVVRIYEAGQAEGHGYLVMELLDSGDLATRLRAGLSLSPRDGARIVAQLARGMAHVHSHGILHRDLKPANVLFGADETPKLVDFGLAHVQGAVSLTGTGQVLGTPAYMAPEQALGLKQVDVRTDVYGLGAILYVCLTGSSPFEGELVEVLERVLSDEPSRPSWIRKDLDPRLEAICLRAMAKDPDARYPDASSLAADLEAWVSGPPAAPQQAQKTLWGGALALVTLALGLAAGIAIGSLSSSSSAPAEQTPSTPEGVQSEPSEPKLGTPPEQAPAPPLQTRGPTKLNVPPADRRLPPRLKLADVQVGSLIMIPISKDGAEPKPRLASVTAVDRSDPSAPRISLLATRRALGPLPVPPEVLRRGFATDSFGVGARVLIEQGGRGRLAPCTVCRRVGPMALIEYPDEDRSWVPIIVLALDGPGVAPGEDAEVELVYTLWKNGNRYPSVLIEEDEATDRVQVVHLEDGTMAWTTRSAFEPRPTPSERVTYKRRDGKRISGVLIGYPGPWLVELGLRDQTRVYVHENQLRITPEDRGE